MKNLISHTQLRDWLAAIGGTHTLIAPRQVEPELVVYQPVGSPDEIAFGFSRATLSPKEFFLPATEAILTVERVRHLAAGDGTSQPPATGGGPDWEIRLAESPMERDQVVFGIRPCDAHALTALDALLLKDPADAYYARRRQRTTLIGLACREMGATCFCTSLGFTPDDRQGMDVMLFGAGDGYVLEVLTDKGRALTAGLNPVEYTGESPNREWPPAEFRVPPRQVWTALFKDPYWGELADRCLSCKICAYVCPTCRCFDVRDYTVAQTPGYQKIERLRCWDGCMADGYRRIAGGHNPRPGKLERLRNRFYCKFEYYPTDFGPMACVGCGRCIDHCPVNVDITEVLDAVEARS
jgi:sulfhydrogenase subunit beta (sulfur reductase)